VGNAPWHRACEASPEQHKPNATINQASIITTAASSTTSTNLAMVLCRAGGVDGKVWASCDYASAYVSDYMFDYVCDDVSESTNSEYVSKGAAEFSDLI